MYFSDNVKVIAMLWKLSASFIISIVTLQAQSPTSANTQALGFSIIPVTIQSGTQSSQVSFWVDVGDAVGIAIGSTRSDQHLIFTDPNGVVFDTASAATDAFVSWVSPDPIQFPDEPGAVYNSVINKPTAGLWTLFIQPTTPLISSLNTYLQLVYQNKVAGFMMAATTSLVSGKVLPVTMALVDGDIKLKTIQITAQMVNIKDSSIAPMNVTFMDDGTNGDFVPHDGTFTFVVPPQAPGEYYLRAQVEGTASTGRFHRTCGLSFKVANQSVQILNTFKDHAIAFGPSR